ncbi:hypothetical protein H5232_17725 [Pseudoalteromonas sp. SG41-5]|uniref:hypothetical protein n=1 Tax=Pseudoalteromonas sp. SG41-5 TaxID=2760975 RepID=UPI0016003BF1|nr:hypothetical protein [Pseudoalteromonas sp. SG41-5]MBB1470269.1 hypothetical protein [Pseudoalteromonas sp. SG41-5]
MLVSNEFFDGSVSILNWYYKESAFINIDQNLLYCTNSLSKEQVLNVVADVRCDETSYLESIESEFFLVVIDLALDLVYLISDITGRDLIYYCEDNNSISTDFWSIVDTENKKKSDIDIQRCKEFILMLSDVEHKTIVNGINILPSASVFTLAASLKVKKKKYWSFKLCKNNLTKDAKYDLLEDCLDSFFSDIASRYANVSFGVGVSGGLDSRLIPYYCNKHEIKIEPFIIGEEKPNIFLQSNDHKRATEICDKYGYSLLNHNFDNRNFREKIRKDALQAPSTASQILKMPKSELITFTHLITGASGYIVGSSPFYGCPSSLDLKATIFNRQTVLKYFPKHKKTKKVLNYIFGSNIDVSEKFPIEFEGVLSSGEISILKSKLDDYLVQYEGFNTTEVLMNYAVDILGQRNKMGAFESLLGEVESFTMYGPNMLKCVESWGVKDIFNRTFFEDFIRERHPELAAIKSQDHKSSLNTRKESSISKIKNILEFTFRGRGVMNYENWAKNNDFLNEVMEMFNEYDYLEGYIELDTVIKNVKKGIISPQVLLNCIKVNELIHLISTRK